MKKPILTKMKIKLDQSGKTQKGEYKVDTLRSLLKEIPFDKISIPAYSYKDLILKNGKPGIVSIGYVNGYNDEDQTFDVCLYENSSKIVEEFKDVVVYVRCYVKDGAVSKIIGLDVCPADYNK